MSDKTIVIMSDRQYLKRFVDKVPKGEGVCVFMTPEFHFLYNCARRVLNGSVLNGYYWAKLQELKKTKNVAVVILAVIEENKKELGISDEM